jgi:hypothetical protein
VPSGLNIVLCAGDPIGGRLLERCHRSHYTAIQILRQGRLTIYSTCQNEKAQKHFLLLGLSVLLHSRFKLTLVGL